MALLPNMAGGDRIQSWKTWGWDLLSVGWDEIGGTDGVCVRMQMGGRCGYIMIAGDTVVTGGYNTIGGNSIPIRVQICWSHDIVVRHLRPVYDIIPPERNSEPGTCV
jgi:hypothetical protein